MWVFDGEEWVKEGEEETRKPEPPAPPAIEEYFQPQLQLIEIVPAKQKK